MPYHSLHGDPTSSGFTTGHDGTKLHWELYGAPSAQGNPTIVCSNGIGCSTFFWHYICRYFAQDQAVLLWDYRGHGESGRPARGDNIGMEDNADDLEAVLRDLDLKDVVNIGHSMGCQVILEHYRRHPERVRALVPMLGTYGRALETFFNTDILARYFNTLRGLTHRFGDTIQSTLKLASKNPATFPLARWVGLVNGKMIRKADILPYMEHMAHIDVRLFMDMAERLGDHSAEEILESIEVPVLIIGGEKDIFTPMWLSEKMHRLIPRSEMTILPAGSHAALVEQPEFINLRIEKFLRDRVWPGSGSEETATAKVLEDTSDTRAHMS